MNLSEELKTRFNKEIIKVFEKNPKRFYIDIAPTDLLQFATYLYNRPRTRFMIASGMDTRNSMEILYHFSDDSTGVIVTLRVMLPDKEKPEIDSLSELIEGANWIEREMHELLGINFRGHTNLKHLILPEDWPENEYPLRQPKRDK